MAVSAPEVAVVEKGCVPADDGEIVGVVGDARLEDFVAFGFGEFAGVSADDLSDVKCVFLDEVRRRRVSR